jgi:hypothetical protein
MKIKLEFAQQLFEIYSKDKLHEEQSGERQVVPRERTEERTDGQA